METITRAQFLALLKKEWEQGEHVVLVGPTGSGKTTVARDLLKIRGYVVVLAVKRHDDTLDTYKTHGYTIIKKWPADYDKHRVIYWDRPRGLDAAVKQGENVRAALSDIYLAGGWCVYFDELGYIAGHLGLAREIGVFLNQGRSSKISVVCAMTRPRSMVQRFPAETINQCRHKLIFKFTDEREIETCGLIAGFNKKNMVQYMQELGRYDFIYVGKNSAYIVKNQEE